MDWTELPSRLAALGVVLDAGALPSLRALRDEIRAVNEHLNLTRIIEEGEFVEKHVLDSLAGLAAVSLPAASFVDVGAGGGFPGLALAIARPLSPLLLVETQQKKARFLEETARALGLANVSVVAERAEAVAKVRREAFDHATVRAVGTVALTLEYTLPLVRVGGSAILYRGPEDAALDDAVARKVAPLLGGGEPRAIVHTLPSGARRRLLVIPKASPTPPGFPRKPGIPEKRPLG